MALHKITVDLNDAIMIEVVAASGTNKETHQIIKRVVLIDGALTLADPPPPITGHLAAKDAKDKFKPFLKPANGT